MKHNKKEINPEPYLVNMTYDEDCWLIIDSRTKDSTHVCFYNQKQDPEKEFEKLNDYAQAYFDDEFCNFDAPKTEYSEKASSASGCNVTEDDYFDEDSRKSWKILVADGQVIEVKTGVKLENIKKEISKVESNLEDLSIDSISDAKDAAEEIADPYKYRGLRRSDFF
jgi:hypothetical protein